MEDFAEVTYNGKTFKLPVTTGTENEKAMDIATLRSASGLITLDSGFKNTGATKSSITFLDGEKGILKYRGYAIEDLAEKSSFMEVSHLLIHGHLPNKTELESFNNNIKKHTLVHEDMRKFFDAYPSKAHPMGVVASLVCSLSTFYPESQNPNRSKEETMLTIYRLMGKMPTISAWAYKNLVGHPRVYPSNKLDYAANFLNMMFDLPSQKYELNAAVVKALDMLLILHADHEQNCSTSTVRIVGSSQANLYSSISAGVVALWGPLHGGANQAVIEMLEKIQKDGGNVEKWIQKAKDKNDPFRLMGFGHRVYKNFDPRAKIIKKACDDVLKELGVQDPLIDIAKSLEEVALSDDYFKERNLYPNVDFYSGIIYKALGIPTEMFTVMFALGRLPGWISQWQEMIGNNEPIGRPRQIYIGDTDKKYVPIEKR
ncbi:MAG: citrate synthase [Bacteroidetes bacterium]|nr:citrate synthase [Bacteroidota bacterium]